MYLRSRIEDTPVFLEVEEAEAASSRDAAPGLGRLIVGYWRPLLVMGGLVVALNVVNYTLLSYMPTYIERRFGLTTQQALLAPLIGMLFMIPFLPLAEALSDRVGRKPLWWASLIGLFVAVVPLYHLMGTSLLGAIIGFAALGLLYAPQLATISATFPAMFPTQVRFAGFAISYNVATSLFGGTAPAMNSWLISRTGDPIMPAYYMMGACLVGMVALRFTIETAGLSLRGRDIPGTGRARTRETAAERPALHVRTRTRTRAR